MNFRLRAYKPMGQPLGILPDAPEVDITTTLNDVHSLNVSYPMDRTNINYLWNPNSHTQSEVALEYYNEGTNTWEEPLGCRFLLMKKNVDNIDDLPVNKFTFLSLKWLLRKVKVWDSHQDKDSEGRIVFREMTIGRMLRLLFNYAYTRGWLLGDPTNLGFTDTHDSGGNSWGLNYTRAFEPTMSLDEVMSDLVEQGLIEWDIQGRKIMVWKDGSPVGLSRNNKTTLLKNIDSVTSSPEEISFENLMTVARVIGDKNLSWVFSNDTISPYGRMEDIVSQAGITDPITAKEATEKILEEGKKPLRTHTKEFAGSSDIQPLRDVRIGDFVTAQTNDRDKPGDPEEMRVQMISVKIGSEDYSWSIDLGDKQANLLAKLAKKQRSLTSGASAGTASSGTAGQATGDWRIPTAPFGVVAVAATHYDQDSKSHKGRWTVTWNDDGMGIDPSTGEKSPQRRMHYELQYRVKGTTSWIDKSILSEDLRTAQIYPIDVLNPSTKQPYQYEIRMRTRGLEDFSPYSNIASVTMSKDTTPPGVPIISVDSVGGSFKVTWAGIFKDGSAPPSDFAMTKVQMSSNIDGPWGSLGDILDSEGGVLYLTGVPSGEARYFRAWSVDRDKNPSKFSDVVGSVSTKLADIEGISDEIMGKVADELTNLDEALREAFSHQVGGVTDGLPRVFNKTTPPSESAPDGSIWFQHKDFISGEIIGQWARMNGSWVPSPISSEAIANLDVGKLTAGSAEIVQAVAQKIYAGMLTANEVFAKQMVISSGNLFPDPNFDLWNSSTWVKVNGGIERNGSGVQVGSHVPDYDIKVTDSDKLLVEADVTVVSGSLPVSGAAIYGQGISSGGSPSGSTTLSASNSTTISAGQTAHIVGEWTAPIGSSYMRPGFYLQSHVPNSTRVRFSNVRVLRKSDSVSIANGSITADKLHITGEMVANFFKVRKVQAGDINVQQLWADQAFLGEAKASSLELETYQGGVRTNVSGRGLVISRNDVQADGSVTTYVSTRLGKFNDIEPSLEFFDPATGDVTASVTSDGVLSGSVVDASEDVVVGGTNLVGKFSDFDYGPGTTSILEGMSWGATGGEISRNDHFNGPWTPREIGLIDYAFTALPGRKYKVYGQSSTIYGNGGTISAYLRSAVDGGGHNWNNPVVAYDGFNASSTQFMRLNPTGFIDGPPVGSSPVEYNIMFSIRSSSPFEFVNGSSFKTMFLNVEDIGPIRPVSGTPRSAILWQADNPSPPAETSPEPPRVSKTTMFPMQSFKSYYAGGTKQQTTGHGSTMLKQGRDPNWISGGIQSSAVLLNRSAMVSTVSGKTVTKATLRVKSAYSGGGGTKSISLYALKTGSVGSTQPSGSNIEFIGTYNISNGSSLNIKMPSSIISLIKSGGLYGFVFTTTSTLSRYSLGLSASASYSPRLYIATI